MCKSNQKKWVDWCEELFEINNWKTKQVEKHSVIFSLNSLTTKRIHNAMAKI